MYAYSERYGMWSERSGYMEVSLCREGILVNVACVEMSRGRSVCVYMCG